MDIHFRSPITFKKSAPIFYDLTQQTAEINELVLSLSKGTRTKIDATTKSGQWQSYQNCEIIQSIIDKRASYVNANKTKIVDKDGEAVENTEAEQIITLLSNPNPLQSGEEFDACVSTYRDIYGFCPIYKVYPANRASGLPAALWAVNPLNFTYVLTGKQYQQNNIQGIVSSITFTNFTGESIVLTGEQMNNIWIINGKTLRDTDLFTSQSPLYSLTDSINTFQISMNVYGTLLEQSILGIISNRSKDVSGHIPMMQDEKKEVQRVMRSQYGITRGKDNYIITSKDLFFQSLLTNVGNLQIPEALKASVHNITRKLGFSVKLLSDESINYDNVKQAQIEQYQNEIIPYVNSYANALTSFLNLKNIRIQKSFEHLPILQENIKERADIFNITVTACNNAMTSGLLSVDECKEILAKLKM
jgi:hypothetical protein